MQKKRQYKPKKQIKRDTSQIKKAKSKSVESSKSVIKSITVAGKTRNRRRILTSSFVLVIILSIAILAFWGTSRPELENSYQIANIILDHTPKEDTVNTIASDLGVQARGFEISNGNELKIFFNSDEIAFETLESNLESTQAKSSIVSIAVIQPVAYNFIDTYIPRVISFLILFSVLSLIFILIFFRKEPILGRVWLWVYYFTVSAGTVSTLAAAGVVASKLGIVEFNRQTFAAFINLIIFSQSIYLLLILIPRLRSKIFATPL